MILTGLFVSLALGFQSPTRAALVPLSSNSGEVRDLIQTDTNTFFAATQGGGIYKSIDGGSAWTRLLSLSERYIWRLAGHSSNAQLLFAATSKGLFKSTNGGANWSQKTFDEVRAVAVDPLDQNHVLIGAPGAGIYVSNDVGDTFSLSNSGLDSLDITAIAFDPLTSGIVYAGLNSNAGGQWGGVFKSINGGNTWSDWNNPNNAGALANKFVTALVVDDQGGVHAGTFNPNANLGGLYKQAGNGGWVLGGGILGGGEVYGVETIVVDKNTPATLWAGTTFFGVRQSTDHGATWLRPKNPENNTGVYSLLTLQGVVGKVLAGVKGKGLYQTSNSGASWSFLSGSGLKADRAEAIVADPSNTLYLGLVGGGVMRSTDGGTSWASFNTGLEISAENNLTVSQLRISNNGTPIYAATVGRGLYRWTGTTWTRVTESGLPNDASVFHQPMGLVVDPVDDRIVYYSLFAPGNPDQGVYRRGTSGTWLRVLQGFAPSRIVMSPINHLRLYALMFDELPSKTENGGDAWTQVNAVHTGFMRLAFYAVAENPSALNTVLGSTNKGLFRSTDGGNNWAAVNPVSGLRNTVLTGLVFLDGTVWAVDRSGGYYCSKDGGANWTALSDPSLGSAIVDLQLINGSLYLITDGNGVLKDASPTCP